MSNPIVTVVIANHNYKHYIHDAIQSALMQDYKEKSIAIIDDGSTDGSIDHIKKLANSWEETQKNVFRTRVNHTPIYIIGLEQPTGPSFARNVAIQTFIDSDVFAILDADDFWYQGKLSKSIELMVNYPNYIGAVYTDYDILSDGIYRREYKRPFDRNLLLRNNIVHSGCVITKNALVSVCENREFYKNDMRVAEDYDLWCRISENYAIVHIPEVLMAAREQPMNSTRTVHPEIWQQNWYKVGARLRQRRKIGFHFNA